MDSGFLFYGSRMDLFRLGLFSATFSVMMMMISVFAYENKKNTGMFLIML